MLPSCAGKSQQAKGAALLLEPLSAPSDPPSVFPDQNKPWCVGRHAQPAQHLYLPQGPQQGVEAPWPGLSPWNLCWGVLLSSVPTQAQEVGGSLPAARMTLAVSGAGSS